MSWRPVVFVLFAIAFLQMATSAVKEGDRVVATSTNVSPLLPVNQMGGKAFNSAKADPGTFKQPVRD